MSEHPAPSRPNPPGGAGAAPRLRGRLGRRVSLGSAGGLLALAALALGAASPAGSAARPTAHTSAAAPAVPASIKKIVWGIDDQNIALFADKRWYALPLKNVRYFVPWDLKQEPHYLRRADEWLTIAGKSHTVPLIAITQSDIRGRTRYLPTLKQYRQDVSWMMHRYKWIKLWTPWNEANLLDQATLKNPARAAQYWRVAQQSCPTCIVTSPSLVGYKDASPKWMRAFVKAAHGEHGPWAIHVYNSINEFNMTALKQLERELPSGAIWVTEANAWLRFVGYPQSLTRQAHAELYLFQVAAASYPRISRWYLYQWFASSPKNRWDSGLVNANGSARPALKVVQQQLG